jgi:FkbM family methyltransferase
MSDLIFDLGFHNGDDTDYYLSLGYSVIAVEANPILVKKGKRRFSDAIESGKLILHNRAFSDVSGLIKFYIHPSNYDWSSCILDRVTWDGSEPIVTEIETIDLYNLYDYGDPYYVKTDVEGHDVIMVKQLLEIINHGIKPKPTFVSFELSKRDYFEIFSYLHVAGYDRYQLVNQRNNDGREVGGYKFSKYSSGTFGDRLPPERWMTTDEAWTNYMKYKELKIIDNQELALGWVDLHATFIQTGDE